MLFDDPRHRCGDPGPGPTRRFYFESVGSPSANSRIDHWRMRALMPLVSEDGTSISVPRAMRCGTDGFAETGMPIDGDTRVRSFWTKQRAAMKFRSSRNQQDARDGGDWHFDPDARWHFRPAACGHLSAAGPRAVFSRDAPAPRARIILRPESGRAVTRKQAVRVSNLVASCRCKFDIFRA